MIKIIDQVAAKWKIVALYLYFESEMIEIIDMDCHHQSVLACRTMFVRWLEGNGRKPTTWRTLITALEDAYISGLAEDLKYIFSVGFSAASSNLTVRSSSPAGNIILLAICLLVLMKAEVICVE